MISPKRQIGLAVMLALLTSAPGQPAAPRLGISVSGRTHRPADAALDLPRFRLTDLGVARGFHASQAAAVNDRSEVVGSLDPQDYHHGRAFFWRRGRMQVLGVSGGYEQSTAAGINNSGEVVGSLHTFFNGAYMGDRFRGFVWNLGKMKPLLPLPGMPDDRAAAVNSHNDIVGTSGYWSAIHNLDNQASQIPHIVLYHRGAVEDLGYGEAAAINDRGAIAGIGGVTSANDAYANHHGIVRLAGHWTDLGQGEAHGLNALDQVVGDTSPFPGAARAVLWDHGRRTLLAGPRGKSSTAMAINDRGQIVGAELSSSKEPSNRAIITPFGNRSNGGERITFVPGPGRALLWQNGQRYDLNRLVRASGWTLLAAVGINNRGQIAGYGDDRGKRRAFLLTPIQAVGPR